MWSRAQLKDKAKIAFKRNYWKVVLVSVIFIILNGGGSSFSFTQNFSSGFEQGFNSGADYNDDSHGEIDGYYSEDNVQSDLGDIFGSKFFGEKLVSVAGIIVVAIVIFLVILVIALVVGFALQAFVFNPLEVGGKRFFFLNLNEKASIKEITFAFENNYMNVVKTLFFRDLYIFLWGLLFIIPGIVKSYEYRMMPYLLAENPGMTKEQAFALSKQMMNGQKWKTFVLDLSFLGWEVLSALTMGILGIFYVTPYRDMTNAALYESLCYQRQWNSYKRADMESEVYVEETTDNNDI